MTAETGATTAKNPSVATFYPDSDDDEDIIKLSDREQHASATKGVRG